MDLWRILQYELQMYYGAEDLQWLHQVNMPQDIASITAYHFIMTSGLTELRALHTRILTEVFLKKGHNDDLNIDYLLPEWRREHLDLIKALQSAYTTDLPEPIGRSPKYCLDKYLAHATTVRGRGFNWNPITEVMDPPLRAIFATLPTDRLPVLTFFRDRKRD